MADVTKQIANLKKQNEGMETSFKNKSIPFTKLSIDNIDPETELMLVKDYNNYLKEISKNNRPPQQKPEEKNAETQTNSLKEDDDDFVFVNEDVISHKTLYNMEDTKRAFFSKDYDTFSTLIKEQQTKLRFYKANYKWEGDNAGRPDYVARNLLRGFVQNLDKYRKYLMVCFRCIMTEPETKTYKYPSYWIVNADGELNALLGDLYDDYNFTSVENDDEINTMLVTMRKNEDEMSSELIGEAYLH
jgi:hypothetical protein